MMHKRRVKVLMGDVSIEGTVSGIDDYCALLVKQDDGSIERVLAGDVTILP
jgi:biotin-(acetyl-CoA carboxylase) ligase